MPANHFNTHCPDWATALLNGFSQIFLQRHPLCGLLCLLAILFTAPALLGGALLGGVAGLLTAQRRGYAKADRQAGLFSYNGVLLGLLLSLYFPWSALLLTPVSAAIGLPTLTAPFILSCWLIRTVVQMRGKTPVAHTPCTLEENQPRLR